MTPAAPKKAFPGAEAHSVGKVGTKDRGFPIGTIHNGRQKVSSNPSKWVELHSGKSYDEHNSQIAHDPHKTVAMEDGHKQILGAIKSNLSHGDAKIAEGMFMGWVDKKTKASNLRHATNVDSSATRALSEPHRAKATKAFDEANKALKELSSFIADSKRRKDSGT